MGVASFWDLGFYGLLWHCAAAGRDLWHIFYGLPIVGHGYIRADLFDLLTPYALLVGTTTIFMLATHGAIYLSMKASGALLCTCQML